VILPPNLPAGLWLTCSQTRRECYGVCLAWASEAYPMTRQIRRLDEARQGGHYWQEQLWPYIFKAESGKVYVHDMSDDKFPNRWYDVTGTVMELNGNMRYWETKDHYIEGLAGNKKEPAYWPEIKTRK